MLRELKHNGVLVPKKPTLAGLSIYVQSKPFHLTGIQAEMALAWAKKHSTPYVQDPIFIRNFLEDFSKALGFDDPLSIDEIDFGPVLQVVETERQTKANMNPEERKKLSAMQKIKREELRLKYGRAIVDGKETEIANYIVEPGCIFMGRGAHPLRGRWKEGATEADIILNLSPEAPIPSGNWQKIVWQPEYLWIARWTDKLSGKIKYVWLHDSAPIKQEREAGKFDKAQELQAQLTAVRTRLEKDLTNDNPKIREIATACFLIDILGLRVGDEKEPDEADTVGATTLRPEHVKFLNTGLVAFHFLGKDSVEWNKKVSLPEQVRKNLAELAQNARPATSKNRGRNHPNRKKPQLFPGIDSRDVNLYLSNILPGLTAKVFRTHHATKIVEQTLEAMHVQASDPEFVKWEAIVKSNLAAAKLCNHTKMPPKNLDVLKQRYQERIERAKTRVDICNDKIRKARETLSMLNRGKKEKISGAKTSAQRKQLRKNYAQKIERQKHLNNSLTNRLLQAQIALAKLKIKNEIATKNYNWNLTTSLKSYIDPRVYYDWGLRVNYDVLGKYYSKALQRKFAWVKKNVLEK